MAPAVVCHRDSGGVPRDAHAPVGTRHGQCSGGPGVPRWAEVRRPPELEGVFTPEDKVGTSIEYNRTDCRAADAREGGGGAQTPARLLLGASPLPDPAQRSPQCSWGPGDAPGRGTRNAAVLGPCTSSWSCDR